MKQNNKRMYDLCKKHVHSYVMVQTNDGSTFDGIITGLDDENVYIAVPLDNEYQEQSIQTLEYNRQFGYGYPDYGFYGGYPAFHGYGFPRRFRRLILPLAALAAISLLPWY